jgi:hypothetical protein
VLRHGNYFWRITQHFIFWMESILRICNSYHVYLHQLNYSAYNRKVINTCLCICECFMCVCVCVCVRARARMLVYIWNIIHLNSYFLIGHYFYLLNSCSSFLRVSFFNEQVCKRSLQITVHVFSKRFLCDLPISFALMFIYCWYESCRETIKIPFPILSLNAYCQLN